MGRKTNAADSSSLALKKARKTKHTKNSAVLVKKKKKPRHAKIRQTVSLSAQQLLLDVLRQKKQQQLAEDSIVTEVENPILDATVHRIRNDSFHKARGILCLSSSHPTEHSLLAVSREGGLVELLDPHQKWRRVGFVPGMPKRSVDCLVWVESGNENHSIPMETTPSSYSNDGQLRSHTSRRRRRLFGASGGDGTIFELDFRTRRHLHVAGSGGGAVFALTVLGNVMAAGCEDGSVRLWRVGNEDAPLELMTTLPTTGAPILSLAWSWAQNHNNTSNNENNASSVLFAGVGDGTIRKYDGHHNNYDSNNKDSKNKDSKKNNNDVTFSPSFRMTLPTRGSSDPTRVWCLLGLGGDLLVSGDSYGEVRFWDTTTGILSRSFAHNPYGAPVLALTASPSQDAIFCTGVDGKVSRIERARNSDTVDDWVLTHSHRPHTHDVRALAVCGVTSSSVKINNNNNNHHQQEEVVATLCSGGVDTKMCTYHVEDFKDHRPKRYFDLPDSSIRATKRNTGGAIAIILSVLGESQVDLYVVQHGNPEALIGSVEIDGKKHNLACSALSDGGEFLAVGDASTTLLFHIKYELEDGIVIAAVPTLLSTKHKQSCTAMVFQGKGDSDVRCFCATVRGPVQVLRIRKEEEEETGYTTHLEHVFTEHVPNINTFSSSQSSAITQMVVTPRYLAIARNTLGSGAVHIFRVDQYAHHYVPPALEAPIATVQLSSSKGKDEESSTSLVVACVNNAFSIFNLEDKALSDWTKDCGFPVCLALPRALINRPDYAVRLAFFPGVCGKFLMGGHSFFCAIDLDQSVPENVQFYPDNHVRADDTKATTTLSQKRSRSNSVASQESAVVSTTNTNNKNFTLCFKYNSMLFLDFVDVNEIVLVEQPWLSVMNALPDALERRVFGS